MLARAGVVTISPAPVRMSISTTDSCGQPVAERRGLDAEAGDRAAERDRPQLRDDERHQAVGQGRVDEVLVGAHALHVGGAGLDVDRDDAVEAGDVEAGCVRAGARAEEVGGLLGQPHRLPRRDRGVRRSKARDRLLMGRGFRSPRTATYSRPRRNGGGVRRARLNRTPPPFRRGRSKFSSVLTGMPAQAAVARLRASYAAIPAGQPVRLAKKTSNLFRPRAGTDAPGLDVSGLDGVIAVDAEARTADVQGMCTYEHLVDATLPHGLIPYVVPQLRTITLGGAVTGLGIESTSFRSGLPHESVVEMDVFTGAGEVVTHPPDGERPVRRVPQLLRLARLRHPAADRARAGPAARRAAARPLRRRRAAGQDDREIIETGEYDGERVDGLDGVAFEPGEYYLTLAHGGPTHPGGGARPATTPASRSTTARSSSARPTC